MIVEGYEFSQGMFQDVTWLMNETEALYKLIVEKHGPTKGLIPLTESQLVKLRGWEPALPLIADNLTPVMEELKVFFVPKAMQPGPAIVFPQRDIYGNYTRARIKPIYELRLKDGPAKYGSLGVKHEWKGPAWFGNSIENTERMMVHQAAGLVEGPMDHLASRLLCPDLPIMSTGTKSLNEKHLDYLWMMDVRRILAMWDNEEGKKAGSGGLDAMDSLDYTLAKDGRFTLDRLICPRKDPAECLKDYEAARALRRLWVNAFG